jgi:class 3 adenylate cyclase
LGLVVEAPPPNDEASLDALTLISTSTLSFLQVRLLLQEERALSRSIDRFVPHDLIYDIGRESVLTLEAGDYALSQKWSIFADIEGFTALSEQLSLIEIRDALMFVFQTIIPYITMAGGIIEKFMGDGFLALFPCDRAPPIEACVAALDHLKRESDKREASGLHRLSMSMTMHGGDVLLCTLGDEERLDITAVSDSVNTCARLQEHARIYTSKLLVTQTIYDSCSVVERDRMRSLGEVMLRGRCASAFIYDVTLRSSKQHASPSVFDELHQLLSEDSAAALEEARRLVARFPEDQVLLAVARQSTRSNDR